jgi:serine/threonine protein kinase
MSDLQVVVDTGSIVNFGEFGDIEVGRFDNNGTNAKIHRCNFNQDYAVKIHRAKKKQDDTLGLDFTAELQFDVSHELICKPFASSIVDLQENRASLVILMPQLFDYEMLRDFSKSNNITLADKVSISKSILEGLNAIHGQGWLHGDLSDRNLMIKRDSLEIRFIDFEWSVRVEETESSFDGVRGTLEMVSPEVRIHETMKALSEKGEIWSVCKIILQIFDNSILKQFKEVDDMGFKNYLNMIGLDQPMYKLDSNELAIQDFIGLVEKGTCGDSNLRPTIDQLLMELNSIDTELLRNKSFYVEKGEEQFSIAKNDILGLEVVLNNDRYCMVRKGRCKSFLLGNKISLEIDFESPRPKMSVSFSGQNHPLELSLGSKFGSGEKEYSITSINEL